MQLCSCSVHPLEGSQRLQVVVVVHLFTIIAARITLVYGAGSTSVLLKCIHEPVSWVYGPACTIYGFNQNSCLK